MLPADEIVRIAIRETDGEVTPDQKAALLAHVHDALERPEIIPPFSKESRPLSVVRFRALLQDTGYPAEVYLPPGADASDWSQLRERWVGWAVEIPGEQEWAKHASSISDISAAFAGLSLEASHAVVKDKHPTVKGTDYTGALLKVYEDFSPSPASSYDVVGLVSAAPMPTSLDDDEDEPSLAPAIHALTVSPIEGASRPSASTARADLLSYLASVFSPPDEHAAELLLLALLARPAVRPTGHPPLGTFALNLVRPRPSSDTLHPRLAALSPSAVNLHLTLPLLHAERFRPKSDGASLSPGLLQLAPGTLLLVDEDGLGAGGALNEVALRNLQALKDAVEHQTVNYEYPYMDGVRIECALRAVISGEGKSLLPCDAVLPVSLADSVEAVSEEQLTTFRQYLAEHGGAAHAAALTIPESVASSVQDRFVEERRAGRGTDDAEGRLKRRMKIAR
ncbi:hypothetical protein CC85DRAFT_185820 [Cutaneotrichosporon oleaginosum]|uniref:Uncharacterized protein n=1 Tax=Cutaneotrichosporon oleaginosum TaxID=879819 RepID=A0A0J0XER4_9TREE|nr:uncharacterized protein CC85DRAFT_185820 [Cutaneotrichosporon oleaginosum]KLT39560.1 hypothetical protein CC85DRAFT_185820 [Cutaneotrichosporon oleaginosum]TXT08018.1 hypothetical protein COLE_04942 [Cutaneotrichosporon oleaginosum]